MVEMEKIAVQGAEEREEQDVDPTALSKQKKEKMQRFLMGLISFPEEKARSLWLKVAPIFSKLFVGNFKAATEKYFEFTSIPRTLFNTVLEKMEEINNDIEEKVEGTSLRHIKSNETKIRALQDEIRKEKEKLEMIQESRRERKKDYKDIFEKIQESIRLMSSLKMSFNEENLLKFKDFLQSLNGDHIKKYAETALGYLDELTRCREDFAQNLQKIEENEIKSQELREKLKKKEEKIKKKERKLSDIKIELEENKRKYKERIESLREEARKMQAEKEKKQKVIRSARESSIAVRQASALPNYDSKKAENALINLRNELSQENTEIYIAEEEILSTIKADLKKCKELQSATRHLPTLRMRDEEDKGE